MFNFGAGRARLLPAGGLAPVELGVVQNASLDMKVDLKDLRGPYRYPIAVADGKGTASGKISFAELWPACLSSILGGTLSDTADTWPAAVLNEKHTVGASPSFAVTLTPPNTGVYTNNSEVVVVNIGTDVFFYTRVLAGSEETATTLNPTGGAYSATSMGVLTFKSTDAGNTVFVTYLYVSGVANDGRSVSVAIGQIGMNTALTFQVTMIGTGRDLYTNAQQQFIVQLNACLAPSLKFDFKLDDFTMMDLDFDAFTDINGNLGSFFLVNPNAAVV